jgi:hypothetical protein
VPLPFLPQDVGVLVRARWQWLSFASDFEKLDEGWPALLMMLPLPVAWDQRVRAMGGQPKLAVDGCWARRGFV